MRVFREEFNCCKSFGCENLGLTESPDYSLSHQLGYPALHCQSCGSYPPLVDNQTINQLVQHKFGQHFALSPAGCPHCKPNFFDPEPLGTQRYGRTSANQPRLACLGCAKVFTKPRWPLESKQISLLEGILAGLTPMQLMSELALVPKLYYQQLQRLATGLRFVSRQLEAKQARAAWRGLLTESGTLEFAAQKRIWLLASADASSGYLYLVNHNLMPECVAEAGHYQSEFDSRLAQSKQIGLLDALRARYKQTMTRPHFEDLNYGQAKPLRATTLVKPASLAYAHFQMLSPFTDQAEFFHHYLEHESCIRGAALMEAIEAIRVDHAEVFYVFRHPCEANTLPKQGNNVGWWNDRWYPAPFGAYSPITYKNQKPHSLDLAYPLACQAFLEQLADNRPYQLKSEGPLNAWLEIQRIGFNYMQTDLQGLSAAMRLGIMEKVCEASDLVHMAHTAIEGYYPN